jgi:hypothetical protein
MTTTSSCLFSKRGIGQNEPENPISFLVACNGSITYDVYDLSNIRDGVCKVSQPYFESTFLERRKKERKEEHDILRHNMRNKRGGRIKDYPLF